MKNLLKDKPLPTGQVLENVGYSEGLSEQPNRIILAPGFQEALQATGLKEALENEGINPKKIAEKINVLLEATDKEGLTDYNAVDKGLKHALAIHDVVPDKPKEAGNTYNFIFNPEVQAKIRATDEEIKRLLTQKHGNNQQNQESI